MPSASSLFIMQYVMNSRKFIIIMNESMISYHKSKHDCLSTSHKFQQYIERFITCTFMMMRYNIINRYICTCFFQLVNLGIIVSYPSTYQQWERTGKRISSLNTRAYLHSYCGALLYCFWLEKYSQSHQVEYMTVSSTIIPSFSVLRF